MKNHEDRYKQNKKDIKEVIEFVCNNKYSNFYKKKYGSEHSADSHESFLHIPFLEKDEFKNQSLEEITMVDEEEIVRYSISGGTSSNDRLVLPHVKPTTMPLFLKEEELSKIGVKTILIPSITFASIFQRVLSMPREKIVIVAGDASRLKLTALQAKLVDAEGLITRPNVLYFLAKRFKEIGYDKNKIKWISLGGDLVTKEKGEYFQSLFPNAKIVYRYGVSEMGSLRGYRCQHLENESPTIYHPAKNAFLEIVDEEGNVLDEGEVGEIVHTELEKKAFPLIRYKTGDMAKLIHKECPCGNNWIIDLEGRKEHDFLRINDIIITSKEIDTALHKFKDMVDIKSQLIVKGKPPKFYLKVLKKIDNINISKLTESISSMLAINENKNLSIYSKEGKCFPLEIELVDEWSEEEELKGKAKNIVRE